MAKVNEARTNADTFLKMLAEGLDDKKATNNTVGTEGLL